jgi:ribosomal protein L28
LKVTGRKTRKGEKRANSQKQEREASSRKTTRRQLMEGWLRRWWISEI